MSADASPYRFRRAATADLPLLAEWIVTPAVAQWRVEVDGSPSPPLDEDDLAEEGLRLWLVSHDREHDGASFGFIQDYDPHLHPGHHFAHLPPGSREVDEFIGVPAMLGGRSATEAEARVGHAAGARACLLDHRLQVIDGAVVDVATERLAALGLSDAAPVFAAVRAPGRSRRPPAPVHGVAVLVPEEGLVLEWTRRARGAWLWRDEVDVPLVEEAERYVVGAGPVDAPLAQWFVGQTALTIAPAELAPLPPATSIWVRQIGNHAQSDPLFLSRLP